MKNLLLSVLIMLAVMFGCNMSDPPDFKPQGWRPAGPTDFQQTFERLKITMQGGFYNRADHILEKSFCIGTNSDEPANITLDSIALAAGGNAYLAYWDKNTTLNGSNKYGRNECGYITARWNFDKPQGDVFKEGARIVFNVKLDGKPESATMEIVPSKDYRSQ